MKKYLLVGAGASTFFGLQTKASQTRAWIRAHGANFESVEAMNGTGGARTGERLVLDEGQNQLCAGAQGQKRPGSARWDASPA